MMTFFNDFFYFQFFLQARVAFGSMICRKETDCKANQCCAMVAMMKSHTGFCMPAKQLGDRCAPTFIVSSTYFLRSVFAYFSHGTLQQSFIHSAIRHAFEKYFKDMVW